MFYVYGHKLPKYLARKGIFPDRRQIADLIGQWLSLPVSQNMLVLSGLQRTGKTISLLQSACDDFSNSAYFLLGANDSWDEFTDKLICLADRGIRSFFIDEASEMKALLDNINVFSENFPDLRFVITGTASLSLEFARYGKLVGRSEFINATWIPFHEFQLLTPSRQFDKYIEFGGVFQSDKTGVMDNYALRSIAFNIRQSLLNSSTPMFGSLRELEDEGILSTVINNVINHDQHSVIMEIVRDWELYDLSMAREQSVNTPEGRLLRRLNPGKIITKVREFLEMKEKKLLMGKIGKEHIVQLKSFFEQMGILIPSRIIQIGDLESQNLYSKLTGRHDPFFRNEWILTQPGLRWNQVSAIIDEINESLKYVDKIESIERKDYRSLIDIIIGGIKNNARGRIMEGILSHHARVAFADLPVFTWRHKGEVDIVIVTDDGIHLYEVKNSLRHDRNFFRHMKNNDVMSPLVEKFGPILSKQVLFRGETCEYEDGQWLNAGEWLIGLEEAIRKRTEKEFSEKFNLCQQNNMSVSMI